MLCCSDERNPFNNVLKEDMVVGKDFQLVSKEQWTLLDANYTSKGGAKYFTVKRYYEKIGHGIRTSPDLMFSKVRNTLIILRSYSLK